MSFIGNKRPLIFGEVLYDCFPDGSRILGGAPFNVAWHLRGFGLNPLLLTRIGADGAGAEALDRITTWGLDTSAVQRDPLYPTGTVAITMDGDQHRFHIVATQAYDYIDRAAAAAAIVPKEVGFLYHGTLALRNSDSRATLCWLRHEVGLPTFIDINLREPWWRPEELAEWLQDACWVKLNDEELAALVPAISDPVEAAKWLGARYRIGGLVVTQGAKGALLLDDDRQVYACPAPPLSKSEVVDTVGAGDVFTAVMLRGLARGWSKSRILDDAVAFAAAICRRRGATVFDRNFYRRLIENWGD